jgi:hypothetical protein
MVLISKLDIIKIRRLVLHVERQGLQPLTIAVRRTGPHFDEMVDLDPAEIPYHTLPSHRQERNKLQHHTRSKIVAESALYGVSLSIYRHIPAAPLDLLRTSERSQLTVGLFRQLHSDL